MERDPKKIVSELGKITGKWLFKIFTYFLATGLIALITTVMFIKSHEWLGISIDGTDDTIVNPFWLLAAIVQFFIFKNLFMKNSTSGTAFLSWIGISVVGIVGIILFASLIPDNLPNTQGSPRYLCNNNEKLYFTNRSPYVGCTVLPLERSWQNLSFSSQYIIDYNPYDIVQEDNKIKVWSRRLFAEPEMYGNNGTTKYDHMIVLNEFHCNKRRVETPIIKYYFRGQFIGRSQSWLEDIEPGSLNDVFYKKICEKQKSPATSHQIGLFDDFTPKKDAVPLMSDVREIKDGEIVILDSEKENIQSKWMEDTIVDKDKNILGNE